MASSRRTKGPGESTVFTTRVASQTTILFAIPLGDNPSFPDPGAPAPTFTWHKELCCEDDHLERGRFQANISAAGALVTVRNVDNQFIQFFTDYI